MQIRSRSHERAMLAILVLTQRLRNAKSEIKTFASS